MWVSMCYFFQIRCLLTRLQFNPTPSYSKKAPFLCELWPIIIDCFTAAVGLVMVQVVLTRKEDFWFLEIWWTRCFLTFIFCEIFFRIFWFLSPQKKIKVFPDSQPSLSTPSQTRKLVVIIMMEEDWYKYLVLFKKLRLVKQNVSKCPFEYCSGKY